MQHQRARRARRALEFLRPLRLAIALILSLCLLVAALNAAEPLVMRSLFDGISRGRDVVVRSVIALVVLAALREGLGAFASWLTWRSRLRLQHGLLDASVGRLHDLPLTYHQGAGGVGATMTRLDRGIQGFVGAFTEVAFNVLPAIVYLSLSVAVMVRLDWRLALVVLGCAPLPALVGAWAAPEQTRRERTLLDRWSRIYARFHEVLSGIVTVKSFAMEDDERRRFLDDVEDANRVVERGVGVDNKIAAAQNLIVAGARIAAVAVGGALVIRGAMTVGTLIAFLGYVAGLFGPVQGLTGVYRTLHKAQVSLDTVFDVLDARDHLRDAPDARDAGRLRGDVRFEGVCFAYPGGRGPLITGIDLHVRAGERVALVGPSGAGKTTMMALLQRFHDPLRGRVLVDGADVRELQQRSLRRNIGVVLQDALLFNDSVVANITYGRKDAAFTEVFAAARAAHAHEFIQRLPRGYETIVGERGGRLSAGERQRVAIARALLKDPAILILDEATSALDAESEHLVQSALDRLVQGRTTFVIAHRLATVISADRIVVLRHGRIEEIGSHVELVRRDGYYASLIRRQVPATLSA